MSGPSLRPAPAALSDAERRQLLEAARKALSNAYAPYSNFQVGAAVLTEAGNLYSGCNVENASYGLTICAERTAICSAAAAEGPTMKIRAIAVLNGNDAPCSPCGACRQFIFEFGLGARVLFQGAKGVEESTASELLPAGFGL